MKFAGFGGIGGAMTLLSMLLIAITNELLGWNPQVSYVVAYMATLLLSYWLNSRLVFHSSMNLRKLAGYCGTYLSGMLLGMLMLKALTSGFPQWNPTLLSYAVIPVTMVWNFIFINRILTHNPKREI